VKSTILEDPPGIKPGGGERQMDEGANSNYVLLVIMTYEIRGDIADDLLMNCYTHCGVGSAHKD